MPRFIRQPASAFDALLRMVCGMELKLLPLCSRSLHRKDVRARPQKRPARKYPEL